MSAHAPKTPRRRNTVEITDAQLRRFQRMEIVGRFASDLAHEVNNFLTVIGGYSDTLLDAVKNDRGACENVHEIQKAVDRCSALTRQISSFSRQQVRPPEVFDLNDLVADLAKMLRQLIRGQIDLVIEPYPSEVTVKAARSQIEQLVMNLVINARDAMPHGGRLTIETGIVNSDKSRASVNPDLQARNYAELAVSDTGTGMDKSTLGRIFEPFFTTKEEGRGTGLGLPIVSAIVVKHEGAIAVDSKPGHGTTVKIYLPQVEKASKALLFPNPSA